MAVIGSKPLGWTLPHPTTPVSKLNLLINISIFHFSFRLLWIFLQYNQLSPKLSGSSLGGRATSVGWSLLKMEEDYLGMVVSTPLCLVPFPNFLKGSPPSRMIIIIQIITLHKDASKVTWQSVFKTLPSQKQYGRQHWVGRCRLGMKPVKKSCCTQTHAYLGKPRGSHRRCPFWPPPLLFLFLI